MNHKHSFIRSQLNILKPFLAKWSLSTMRRAQESVNLLTSASYKDAVRVEQVKVGDMRGAMLTPKEELLGGVVLFMHGGGYCCGGMDYALSFASMLSAKCGIRVFTYEYRLAPEHPFPAALDDTMDAYGYLLSSGYEPSRILLCGESSGGGLCYSLCQKLRDKGRTMPAGIVAISPWTDLSLCSQSYTINEKIDPLMTVERLKYFADSYLYGASVGSRSKFYPNTNPDKDSDDRAKRDPKISPLFDSKEKMPESLIFVGSDEIMYDDAVLMHQGLVDAGCKSELVIGHDLWHDFVLYDLPDRAGDFDKIFKFIRKLIPLRNKLAWMTLDNAAKLFPAARSKTWSNMFRISATLNEEIDREALRVALDVTVRRFPSIAVSIKEGFFWYYLEQIAELPPILDEKPYPLSRMTPRDLRKCAFRVLVYKNRLAVEFFHSLTDGTGGLNFTKTLTAEYIYQKYGVKVPVGNGIYDRLEDPSPEEIEDSFFKSAGKYPAARKDPDVFKIMGKREVDGFRTNTTFIMDSDFVRAEAKKRGVTVNVYLTAMLTEATIRVQEKRVMNPAKYRPVRIFVPVNLRKIFSSVTLRNFIGYAYVGVDPKFGKYSFDDLCYIISGQMKEQMTKERQAAIIRKNVDDESSLLIRTVPLFIKNIVIKTVYDHSGENKTCFSFSNLGAVNMPEEFSRYVKRMDFVIGPQSASPYNVSALSYGGKLYLNVVRNSREPVFERMIYQLLREMDVPHTVESNTRGKGDFECTV